MGILNVMKEPIVVKDLVYEEMLNKRFEKNYYLLKEERRLRYEAILNLKKKE